VKLAVIAIQMDPVQARERLAIAGMAMPAHLVKQDITGKGADGHLLPEARRTGDKFLHHGMPLHSVVRQASSHDDGLAFKEIMQACSHLSVAHILLEPAPQVSGITTVPEIQECDLQRT